ncbi:N6-adenine specific DNA methyltransferase [Ochrobactrum phage vB_OspM_OC]|nr:N6-adenine specific DNA methyltransferase [Ochrobactrum phage vB_OspM_OC]
MENLTLFNGNCLDFLKTLEDETIDLVVTDPPYRVISGGKNDGKDKRPSGILTKNDGKIFNHNDIQIVDYLPELYRVLKPNTDAYIMTNNINLRDLLNIAHDVGFKLHNLLVWEKNNVTPNRWYMKNLEYTVYLYKGNARPINNPSSKQSFNFPNPRNKVHPTEKPVELMEHYILNSSDPGAVVLDPFLGGGATGVAAIRNDRKFVGCELEENYFNIAKERIEGELTPIFI